MNKMCRTNTQFGRSMIEMLGVLAIIGVLSVGGIVGYSKAMFKYHLNKQSSQLTEVINSVAKHVNGFKSISVSENVAYAFIALGEFDDDMIRSDKIYDVFGFWINIYTVANNGGKSLNIQIAKNGFLTQYDKREIQICQNIIMTAKENSESISVISSIGNIKEEDEISIGLYGDEKCNERVVCLKNISMKDIMNFCTKNIGKSTVEFKISWIL